MRRLAMPRSFKNLIQRVHKKLGSKDRDVRRRRIQRLNKSLPDTEMHEGVDGLWKAMDELWR
jgi:hypothetical protein